MTDEPDMEAAHKYAEGQLGDGPEAFHDPDENNLARAFLKLYGEQKSGKRQRRTRIPADWRPVEPNKSFSFLHKCGLDFGQELIAFQLHHEGKGTLMLSWDRAWQTWCRNAKKFAEERRLRGAKQGPASIAEAARQVIEAVDRRDERAGRPQSGGAGDSKVSVFDSKQATWTRGPISYGSGSNRGTQPVPLRHSVAYPADMEPEEQVVADLKRDTGRVSVLGGEKAEDVEGD